MPIKPSKQTEPISYDEFHALDYDAIAYFRAGEEMVLIVLPIIVLPFWGDT